MSFVKELKMGILKTFLGDWYIFFFKMKKKTELITQKCLYIYIYIYIYLCSRNHPQKKKYIYICIYLNACKNIKYFAQLALSVT